MEHFYRRVTFLVFSLAVGIFNSAYAVQNDALSSYFVENKGQVLNESKQPSDKVLFYSIGGGMQIFVTGTGYSLLTSEDSEVSTTYNKIDIQLVGATIRKENVILVKGNYPKLNFYQSARKIEDVLSSNTVIVRNIYPGIDWLWTIDKDGEVKHEFMVNLGADASKIKYQVAGAECSAGRSNNVVYENPAFGVSEGPVLIQYKDTMLPMTVKVEGKQVSFPVPDALQGGGFTIDPPLKLIYSDASDNLKTGFRSIALDANHSTISTGYSRDYAIPVFPETITSFTSFPSRSMDIIIMKSDSVQDLKWATFFGGVNRDEANAVVAYPGGIFITGFSESWDFPVAVAGNYNELVSLTGRDAFIAKFDKFGKYQWSTGYGGRAGADEGMDIQYYNGKIYVAGYTSSTNFPQQQRAGSYYYEDLFRERTDAFILEFDTSCNRRWATTFGSSGHDYFTSLSVDGSGIYLSGYADSITGAGIPLVPFGSAYFQSTAEETESFITAFTSSGSLEWSTYFGAERSDIATSILHNDCGLFICGRTTSADLPVQSQGNGNYYQSTNAGGANDGFITRFDVLSLQKVYCTYYGTAGNDVLTKMAGNAACETIFTGFTDGNITIHGTPRFFHQNVSKGGIDGMMLGLNAQQAPFWATYFGSIRNDYAHDVEFYNSMLVDMVGEGFYNYGRPRIGGTYLTDGCTGKYCALVSSNGAVNRFLNNDSIFLIPGYCKGCGGGGPGGPGGGSSCDDALFFQALIPLKNTCPSQCNGEAMVDTANVGGCPPYTMLWNTGRIGIRDTGLCEFYWSKVIDTGNQTRTIYGRFDVLRVGPSGGVITNCGITPDWDTIIHPEGGGPPYTINFRGVLNESCPTTAYFDIRDTADCIVSYSLPWYRYNTNLFPKLKLTASCELRASIKPKSEQCLDYSASATWKYVVYSATDTFSVPFVKDEEVIITTPTNSSYYEGYLDLGTCTQAMDRLLFSGKTLDSVNTKINCQTGVGQVLVTVYPDTVLLGISSGYWVKLMLKGDTTNYKKVDSVFINTNAPKTYTFSSLASASYYASVYTNACDSTFEKVEIKILSVALNTPSSYCGQTDTLIATATGGNPPYIYEWSNGNSTDDRIPIFTGGTYAVTVSDSTGCDIQRSFFVPSTPGFEIDSVTENLIPCSATLFSKAIVFTHGGTSPYFYLWSSGESTTIASFIPQGANWVIARDVAGCADTVNFLNTKQSLVTVIDTVIDVTCFGYANGSITLNITNGYPFYDVRWSDSSTGASINQLDIGNYQYTVTDAKGCTTSGFASIDQPDSIKYFATSGDATCAASDGFAAVSVTGGVSPFSIQWSDSSTLFVRQNLAVGSYTFTLTDGNGCNKPGLLEIGNKTLMYLTADVKNITCSGSQNGSIDVSVFNAFSPFTFHWSNNSNVANLSNLDSGFYKLTVTDNQGCVKDTTFYIKEPLPLQAVLDTGFGIRCFANTVEVKITATGGTAPYYGTDTITQGPGVYSVMIVDTMGCSTTLDYSLSESPFLDANLTVSQQPDCRHPLGTLMATATGGLPPYLVYVNGIPRSIVDTTYIGGLLVGTHLDSIVDFSGCAVEFTNEIVAYDKVDDTTTFTNPTCFTSNNGSILITMKGLEPFDYQGNIFSSTYQVDSLYAGQYSFIINDSVGCPDTVKVTLTSPPELKPKLTVKEPIHCTGDSALVYITATGGVSPYFGTDTIRQPAAVYQVIITDSVGCTATLDYVLIDPPLFAPNSVVSHPPDCNNVTGTLGTATGGGLPYRFYIDSILRGSFLDSLSVSGIVPGTHSSYIIDSNGCSKSFSAVLNPYTLLQDSVSLFNPTCFGLNNGSATLHLQGMGPFSYQGNFFASTYKIDSLLAGDYSFVVSDTLGCPDTINLSLASPPELKGNYQIIQGIICHPDSALLNITSTGGTFPVTGGGNYQFPEGIFQVTLTDSFGCTAMVTDTLVAPPVLTEQHITATAGCLTPGSVTITAAGGVGPYQLLAGTNNYVFRDTISYAAVTGSYVFKVKDSLGCIIDVAFTIGANDSIKGNIRARSLRCNNDTSGQVVITMEYGNKPYLVNGTSFTDSIVFNKFFSGPYIYNVTDAHGCSAYLSGILTQPDPIRLDSNIIRSGITCDDREDAVIKMNVFGGVPGYAFALDTGGGFIIQRNSIFTGIASGNYIATVTDTVGCKRSLAFAIPPFVPSVHDLALGNLACYDHPEGTIKIYSQPGDRGTYTYSLNKGIPQVYNVFSGLSAGSYTIVVSDGNGCLDTLTTQITQPDSIDSRVWLNGELLSIDSTFIFERNFAEFTKLNQLPWTIDFSPDAEKLVNEDTLITIQPRGDITYLVTVYADSINSDCYVQYQGLIRLIGVPDLPNIITPNGDGLNDKWEVDLDKYPDPDVIIFDRWGETIYSAAHYRNEWDGSYKQTAKRVPDGTYFYIMKVPALGDVVYKGNINVLDVSK